MNLGLAGRAALVTGASQGIGRAIAAALAAEGVRVLATARNEEALKALEQEAPQLIRAQPCDLLDREGTKRLVARTLQEFGRLDILVNNAGFGPHTMLLDQDFRDWDTVMAVNVTAPAVLAQAAGPHFAKQHAGKVINIASTCSIRGVPGLVAYCTAKGAVLQFTKALAIEWASLGVQVNAIGPGATATPAQRELLEGHAEQLEARLARIPDGRMAGATEVAALVCYLASPLSDHITGELIMIDGGETAKLF